MAGNPLHKRYIANMLQYNPEVSFWNLGSIISLAANDVAKWGQGWLITQPIGRHPIEASGLRFLAEKAYTAPAGGGNVKLYFSTLDLGYRVDHNGQRFHATQLDANFVDSAKTWRVLAAEQIVGQTLNLLYHTFDGFYGDVTHPFWYRVSGSWVCGSVLYQCPDWTG
ncbi:MAG TPA: hypothetical protein VJZ91_19730 [Blastocatellia bacterium]|nr:hypothetical protein [Blastocatellia bacterium]